MEQATRNKLRSVVTQCRKLLEESIAQQLEGQFGIRAGKKDAVQIEDEARMSHLSDEDQQYRRDLLDHLEHIKARSFSPKDSLDQLIREVAFTHLNRLCAYKMMEARDVYVGGQKFREAVSRGIKSNGFLMDGRPVSSMKSSVPDSKKPPVMNIVRSRIAGATTCRSS